MSPRFLPTASVETLKLRSRLIASLREFFRGNGYWECETPILSRELIVDANLDPFVTHDVAGGPYYLQTSPEAGMKRLLSAGADAIFQITRAMRRGETGRFHNPEFTMAEWYRAGDDHHDQMDFVERLVRAFYEEARRQQIARSSDNSSRDLSTMPFERLTYDEAFERFSGTRVRHLSSSELGELAGDHGVAAPPAMNILDRDGWLNLLLAELVEPHLGRDFPQFVYDYPASQAALSKTRWNSLHDENSDSLPTDSFEVAERFELYDRGVELCNGYHELTDADEFVRRSRIERENSESEAEVLGDSSSAPLLEGAMREGIPGCAGVALGLDRLVMLALGKTGISDVIAFPGERA
jgi:lysyl-tRNA synthetase class 2